MAPPPVTSLALTPMPPPPNYPSATLYPGVGTFPGPNALTLTPVD